MLRGRAPELNELRRALTAAKAGQRQVHALVGEPGIGKTSVATEISQVAATEGFQVVWGRAWEAGGAAAFWPWRQLIDSLPKSDATARLPELWERSGTDHAFSDPAQQRLQLFDAVAKALKAASEQQPLLCVLDDLHVADTASLELLAFVLRGAPTGRCAWLLTWRDAEAERPRVRDLLAAITREAHVLPLRSLSEPDSASLIADALGAADDATARMLFRATSGNPLFLVEVLRSLALRGAEAMPSTLEQVPVTQGVAQVVRERCRDLAPDATALLEAASVIGRDAERQMLCDATQESNERVRLLAQQLVSAGFLRERGEHAWSFSHALVRDALYRGLTPQRRRSLHARLAAALDERLERGHPGLARARAHHGLLALPDAPAASVALWSIAAAADARAQCAFDDAVSILETARAELAADPRSDAELLIALGAAHGDAGRTLSMRESLQQAIALARKLGDPHLLARAVLASGSRYVLGDVRTDLLPLLDEAEHALGSERGGLHARILARRAAALTPAPDSEIPLLMARAAIAEIDGADRAAFIDVAVAAGSAFGDFADASERMQLNHRLVAAAREEHDHVLELRGLGRLVTDYLEQGDVARADATLGEWSALNAVVRSPAWTWMEPLLRSMRAMVSGELRAAYAATDEAAAIAEQTKPENSRRCLAVHRHWLYLLADDLEALGAHEPEAIAAIGPQMAEVAALAHLTTLSRTGQLDAVRGELLRSIPTGLPKLHAGVSLATLGEAIAPLGRTDHGHEVRRRLTQRGPANANWGLFGFTCGPPTSLALAMLCAAEGDVEEAQRSFAAALERTRQMRAPLHEAWVEYGWGAAGLGDRRAHLERAAELAHRLEVPHLQRRAEAALGTAVETKAKPAPAAPSSVPGFTLEREGEGWRLTVAGRSNYLRDVRGLEMLARLLAQPGEELHSLELASRASAGEAVDAGDSGELLDSAAIAAYQKRARSLSQELDEAEQRGDTKRADAAQAELDALAKELARAKGLGGRKRRAGVAAERARVVVTRRVREAIAKIAQLEPELGAQLDRCVRTGTFCSYVPSRKLP